MESTEETYEDDAEYYTIAELARLLKVSHAYAHSLVATQEIHALNFGAGRQRAMWRIPREEVERWIASRKSNRSLKEPRAPKATVQQSSAIVA